MTVRLASLFLVLSLGCTAPPREQPTPELPAATLETQADGTLELRHVRLVAIRSGKERPLRELPVRGERRGVAWGQVRTIVVPPREAWAPDEEGQLSAALEVQAEGGGHTVVIDAGAGRMRFVLRGRDANGLVQSIDLLDCVKIERR